ncbi:hypothetical protein LEP1GSC048_0455 [Leptospira santarosai serovar Shermani str. 1342KT]|nr:hypothetical protein LEP1GSC048_0455 [Leptospira santarosai serovar Shermani str. 1342KT]
MKLANRARLLGILVRGVRWLGKCSNLFFRMGMKFLSR